jgi:hypothetical protein
MMEGRSTQPDHSAAAAMLELFASVGAQRFAVTWIDSAGEPRHQLQGQIRTRLPACENLGTAAGPDH